jgi:hypothetical protein
MINVIGQEIKPGSIIAYPGRHGSSTWMNIAIVTEEAEKQLRILHLGRMRFGEFTVSPKQTALTSLGSIVVIHPDHYNSVMERASRAFHGIEPASTKMFGNPIRLEDLVDHSSQAPVIERVADAEQHGGQPPTEPIPAGKVLVTTHTILDAPTE